VKCRAGIGTGLSSILPPLLLVWCSENFPKKKRLSRQEKTLETEIGISRYRLGSQAFFVATWWTRKHKPLVGAGRSKPPRSILHAAYRRRGPLFVSPQKVRLFGICRRKIQQSYVTDKTFKGLKVGLNTLGIFFYQGLRHYQANIRLCHFAKLAF